MADGRPTERTWSLTAAGFHRLLALLDADPERAGEKYEALRRRLTAFFEWRGSWWPETHTDETINRVARRIEDGEPIASVEAYSLGVARILLLEVLRRQEKERAGLAALAAGPDPGWPAEPDPRWNCLDACLAELPGNEHRLILDYYRDERGGRAAARQALAARLGVPHNVLRGRAFRIRERLQECVVACLDRCGGRAANVGAAADTRR
jgi:DNA-directed RNA polymerase specialized sigma24 family protein